MSTDDHQVARALDRLCVVCEERERNDGHYWCQQCYEKKQASLSRSMLK